MKGDVTDCLYLMAKSVAIIWISSGSLFYIIWPTIVRKQIRARAQDYSQLGNIELKEILSFLGLSLLRRAPTESSKGIICHHARSDAVT